MSAGTRRMALILLLMAVPSVAQEPAAATPSTETPAQIYDRAMQPVEIVRRSPNNVTDSEVAAWGVAVVTAAHACADRKVEDFSGEDLFHYARLCQLGQQYDLATGAATKYLKDGNSTSAESARALIVRAQLSAGNTLRSEQAAYDLMRNHPYDGTVHTMVQEVIMSLAATDAMENALRLVEMRSEPLMAAMREGKGLALHEGSYRVPQSVLVRDALSAAYFYRAENRIGGAQAKAQSLIDTIRQIVSDTAGSAAPLEREAMSSAIQRADLLNAPVPEVPIEASSLPKTAHPLTSIAYEKKVTVLAFYAPWSPQRKAMFELLGSIARDYKIFPVQIFAISTPMAATGDVAAPPADVLSSLVHQFDVEPAPVPIVVTADDAAHAFAVDDWPMFAVIDTDGKVRFLDTLSSFEYKDGGRMHRLVAALASQAGPLPQPPAIPQSKSKSKRIFVPSDKLQRLPKK